MTEQEKNDLFYVCSLIEYIARQTKNKRGTIVEALGESGVRKQLYDAQVNHCLSFEQVSDEIIEQYQIRQGDFDTITDCKYTIPGFQEEVEELMKIFTSFISDEISDFQTDVYYQNPSYLECSYKAGHLLD